MFKRTWMLMIWACVMPAYAAALSHSSANDFNVGSNDGNVEVISSLGDGALRLEKLAGSLGPWSTGVPLPVSVNVAAAWAVDGKIFAAGGARSAGPWLEVYSSMTDAMGNMGPWTYESALPMEVGTGTARWADRLYMGAGWDGSAMLKEVWMAQIGSNGLPGAWTRLIDLPAVDRDGRLLAEKGWLYYLASRFNGGPSSAVYRAPILTDGTIGNWALLPGSRSQATIIFGVASAMGAFFTIGGELGDWLGEKTVDRALVSDSGSLSAWAVQPELPARRSMNGGVQACHAGRLFQVGGKTFAGVDTFHADVYSSVLGAGAVPGVWQVETSLPALDHMAAYVETRGRLYAVGGSNELAPCNAVYSAALNQGSANAAEGVYINRFDLGSDQPVGQIAWDASPSNGVELQLRSALHGGSFGGWTSASSSSPKAISWTARYVEYRLRFLDVGGGDVTVASVELGLPTPTATVTPSTTPSATASDTPTASPTPTPSATATVTPVATNTMVVLVPTATATPTYVPTALPPAPEKEGEARCFPNPARGAQTHFAFELHKPGRAKLSVWNAAGQLSSQVEDHFGEGKRLLHLTVKDYAPGVYLYQVTLDYDDGRSVQGPVKRFAVIP